MVGDNGDIDDQVLQACAVDAVLGKFVHRLTSLVEKYNNPNSTSSSVNVLS